MQRDRPLTLDNAANTFCATEQVEHVQQTVTANLTIENGWKSPDGYPKQVITVNGQLIGPMIRATEGDMIEVAVTNKLYNQQTTVHWHGMSMQGTPEMDGAMGISQVHIVI
jgi:FtsP/CotA-like multicopper oxidase with cupredoxin domain